jgi:hypothetical protein
MAINAKQILSELGLKIFKKSSRHPKFSALSFAQPLEKRKMAYLKKFYLAPHLKLREKSFSLGFITSPTKPPEVQ